MSKTGQTHDKSPLTGINLPTFGIIVAVANSFAAVRCFADVAKVVGVKTVAEYDETREVLERLRSIGVDFVQGFIVHRPSQIDELLILAESA